jgi:transposase
MRDLGFEPPLEQKPDRPQLCPMCGEETESVYKDRWGRIVGCPGCVEEVDEWPE